MLSRKRQERKMMMKTAKTLGFAGSVPAVFKALQGVGGLFKRWGYSRTARVWETLLGYGIIHDTVNMTQ